MKRICGLDEAGRGSLAGPMILAAVVLDDSLLFSEIAPKIIFRDSKLLSDKQRELCWDLIQKHSLQIEVEFMSVSQINRMGVGRANILGFRRLINRINADQYIVDGNLHLGRFKGKTERVRCIVDADATILSTMCAGIVAKQVHNRIMEGLHKKYPAYSWRTNAGHGTAQHILALHEFGVTKFHRIRFVETALKNFAAKMALS